MVFGDGGSVFSAPPTCPEICAHELTHGITEFSAGLIYQDESGALNESFSDIFGTVIEAEFYPTGWDWIMGAQVTANGSGIRNMQDPPLKNNPDTYGGPLWVPGGSVHSNSGVQNKWFQLLTDGGADTNAVGDIYSVNGIGMTKAAAISFRNLTVYLTPASTYADARFFAIESAKDLYGTCSNEMVETVNAWYAVGVGAMYSDTPSVNFSAWPATVCALPADVTFRNQSSPAASWYWDFGDGSSSTLANPTHTYSNWGTYTVKLVATGCTGLMDSLVQTNLIVVDSNIVCPFIMEASTWDTVVSCSGLLLDPGGVGNYPDNSNSIVTIAPPQANNVTLTFSLFDLEPGYDFLSIYDGPDTTSLLIGVYSGFALPNGGTLNASGGAVTLAFRSDFSITEAGFELTWNCGFSNPPIAGMETSLPFTCRGQVAFYDRSSGAPTSWNWDFGDGISSSMTSPFHIYQSSGTYTVTLEVCNANGCDTIVYPNLITVNLLSSDCDTLLFPTSGANRVIECSGVLQDYGGSGPYSLNQNNTVTIAPPGAEGMVLDFTEFRTHANLDYLSVYDGPDINAPLIGAYSGFMLPSGGTIRTTGGVVTLRFQSTFFQPEDGFTVVWKAIGSNTGPFAAFVAPDTALVNTPVNFDEQCLRAISWRWDFGDGSTSTLRNPAHTYTVPSTYQVLMEVEGSVGCLDTMWHKVVVKQGVSRDAALQPASLQIWPNPATEEWNLAFEGRGSYSLSWQFSDVFGRVLRKETVTAQGRYSHTESVAALSPGIYFLRLETRGKILTRKVWIR